MGLRRTELCKKLEQIKSPDQVNLNDDIIEPIGKENFKYVKDKLFVKLFIPHSKFQQTTLVPLLNIVAENDYLNIFHILKKEGCNVNLEDKDGYTPLHLAAKNGHLKMIEFLIKEGAEINIRAKDGYTSLHLAAENGYSEVVKLLIEKGANVNLRKNTHEIKREGGKYIREKDKDAPLHSAAKKGHLEVVKLLIEKGAEIDVMNSNDYTPLHLAVKRGHLEVVRLLIKKGADIEKKAKDGSNPLQLVLMGKKKKTRDIFSTNEKQSLIKDLILFHSFQTKPDFINANDKLSQFWDKCSNEIKKIQNSTYGSILYQLLQETDENKLANLIRKSDKQKELVEFNYEEKFPIYGIELKHQVELGVQRLLDNLLLKAAHDNCPEEIINLIKRGS